MRKRDTLGSSSRRLSKARFLMIGFLIDAALAIAVSLLIGGFITAGTSEGTERVAAFLIGLGMLGMGGAFSLVAYLIVLTVDHENRLQNKCLECNFKGCPKSLKGDSE